MTAADFWKLPNTTQSQLYPITHRAIRSILPKIRGIQPPEYYPLSRNRVYELHGQIDEWHEADYYGSSRLEKEAQFYRRRLHIRDKDAFSLLVLSVYIQVYRSILDKSALLYENIFKNQYLLLTNGEEYETMVPYSFHETTMPNGSTILDILFLEAAFRATRLSHTVNGLAQEPDFSYDEPTIERELTTAQNGLLKETSTGNWIGILDIIMTLIVGMASMSALEATRLKYKYHAVMDDKTTDVCSRLNGKVFDWDEAIPGITLPPATAVTPHWCRSWIELLR